MNLFEVIDIVYKHLKNGLLDSAISGEIYKVARPVNSENEDVVINSLGLNNTAVQQGVINVNIHVPNMNVRINNIQTHDIPNHQRLLALATVALSELDEVWDESGGYSFEVQQHIMIQDGSETYINIRLNFFSINNNI